MTTNTVPARQFVEQNAHDLKTLGLFFLQMLVADWSVASSEPSAVLVAVMQLEGHHLLGTTKSFRELRTEMLEAQIPIVHDGFGGSIFRL